MLLTAALDDSDMGSVNDSGLFEIARVCMATHEAMEASINLDERSDLVRPSSNFDASQETEASMDTSPIPARSK